MNDDYQDGLRTERHEATATEQRLADLEDFVERQGAELALLRAEHDAARTTATTLIPQRAALNPAFVVWLDAWTETETAR